MQRRLSESFTHFSVARRTFRENDCETSNSSLTALLLTLQWDTSLPVATPVSCWVVVEPLRQRFQVQQQPCGPWCVVTSVVSERSRDVTVKSVQYAASFIHSDFVS